MEMNRFVFGERGIHGAPNLYSEWGIRLEKQTYLSKALALSITKLKVDYDYDSPIESYATLKIKSWPDRLGGRNRLAPIGTS